MLFKQSLSASVETIRNAIDRAENHITGVEKELEYLNRMTKDSLLPDEGWEIDVFGTSVKETLCDKQIWLLRSKQIKAAAGLKHVAARLAYAAMLLDKAAGSIDHGHIHVEPTTAEDCR